MLEPLWTNCIQKVKEETNSAGNYSIVKSRTFLQLPLNGLSGREYDAHHVDLLKEHFALLYYVCDADGDTVIFENMYSESDRKVPELHELKEKMRVTPKQGRVVIFDGYYWHTATQPAKSVRCVINTDVVQHA
jgi:ectoine hydroxylase-related dioxygenase (phytanoyl-CoA dioxygenase family)